jgi:hypothetical protein
MLVQISRALVLRTNSRAAARAVTISIPQSGTKPDSSHGPLVTKVFEKGDRPMIFETSGS